MADNKITLEVIDEKVGNILTQLEKMNGHIENHELRLREVEIEQKGMQTTIRSLPNTLKAVRMYFGITTALIVIIGFVGTIFKLWG